MKFLADESVHAGVTLALRNAEHDVIAIAEQAPQTSDEDVATLAKAEGRILLTEDRDFGRLIYALAQEAVGIVYMRYPAGTRKAFARAVTKFVADHEDDLVGSFVVLQPGRSRISRLPE